MADAVEERLAVIAAMHERGFAPTVSECTWLLGQVKACRAALRMLLTQTAYEYHENTTEAIRKGHAALAGQEAPR